MIKSWAQISDFCLTKQTSKTFVITLRGQAMLMQELLDEGYEFIFTHRFQSGPLENRFFQYRQMSGGRFLMSLQEILSTERILTCRSLLKQNIIFWEENLKPVQKNDKILNILAQHESEISSSCHQTEVIYTISGYITNKLIKHFQCEMCSLIMVSNDSGKATDKEYFYLLSRGGLNLSRQMAEFVCVCSAKLEYADQFIVKNHESITRVSAEQVLGIYSPKYSFTCEKHIEKVVVNIFYSNKQKISSDEVRKNTVECF